MNVIKDAEGAIVCKKMIRYLDQAKLNPLKPCCAIEDGSLSTSGVNCNLADFSMAGFEVESIN